MRRSNLEILAHEPSRLGMLCLRRRELLSKPGTIVTEITLNQELLMSSYLTVSECALARLALQAHPGSELQVLVGGLGLGYTAREVVASARVASVEVVEYLPEVIGWFERGLIPLAGELQADARMKMVEGDIYGRLTGAPASKYDVILIDVDHSPGEHLDETHAFFYAQAGLDRARAHLAPGGVLAVWSYAEHSPFADALRKVFRAVRVEPITVTNDLVGEGQTDWLFIARS